MKVLMTVFFGILLSLVWLAYALDTAKKPFFEEEQEPEDGPSKEDLTRLQSSRIQQTTK